MSHWPVGFHVFYVSSFPELANDSIELHSVNLFFRAQHVRSTGHRANMDQRGAGVTADLI